MTQEMSNQERVNKANKHLEELESDGLKVLYGEELGIAKLVRDGRTFRIFVKEVQQAKSGKAVLVDMDVFVQKDGKAFAQVSGHTYIPNFVMENKDIYWILGNKIHGKTQEDPRDMSIDSKYVPKEFRGWLQEGSWGSEKSPEETVESVIESSKEMKVWFERDLKVEKAILGFFGSVQ